MSGKISDEEILRMTERALGLEPEPEPEKRKLKSPGLGTMPGDGERFYLTDGPRVGIVREVER